MKYWKEHFNDNATKFKDSLLKQVDMTLNGNEVSLKQVDLRINAIKQNLFLDKTDVLLDICCGNGLITKKLSAFVQNVYGLDFSEGLIEIAKSKNKSSNVIYEIGDITKINLQKYKSINKINVYAGLQYISIDELKVFFDKIKSYEKPLTVYCANVPDKECLWNYYDTSEKKAFYHQRELEGMPHIGTWFYKDDFTRMAKSLGLYLKFLEIEKGLNTTSYRFDILLSNNPF